MCARRILGKRVNPNSQASWLEGLDFAGVYSDWVFEQTKPYLGPSILEIGCGRGTYTTRLAQAATRVVAIDIDEGFVKATRGATSALSNVEVRQADVSREPFDEKFDTVFMLDVLEHIAEDRALLAKLARTLRPGGRLVVKVPAFNWLFGPLDQAVGHRRRYSRAALSRDLVASGFGPPDIWYFNAAAIPGWWLNGVVLRRTMAPSTQISLFERVLPLVKAVDRFARPFAGLSLFGVAKSATTEIRSLLTPVPLGLVTCVQFTPS